MFLALSVPEQPQNFWADNFAKTKNGYYLITRERVHIGGYNFHCELTWAVSTLPPIFVKIVAFFTDFCDLTLFHHSD